MAGASTTQILRRWCIVVVGLLALVPGSASAATTLDATGCSAGSARDFPLVTPGMSYVTGADCSITFGSDSTVAEIRAYQSDGTGAALQGFADYAAGATDWDQGASAFGACLRAGSQIDDTWSTDANGTCSSTDSDPWNGITATSSAGSEVARTSASGIQNARIDLRFGLRAGTSQTGGAYAGTVVVEVLAPGVGPPVNTTLPSISGAASEGATLSAVQGVWTGNPTSWAYQWRRCNSSGASCTDIPSATNPTYLVQALDVGGTIRLVVTATNGSGSTPATSNQTAIIQPLPPITYVGHVGSDGGRSGSLPTVVTVPAGGIPAGRFLVASTVNTDAGAVSMSDSRGNTWQLDAQASINATVYYRTFSTYVTVPLIAGDQISVSWAGTQSRAVTVTQFSGVSPPPYLDRTGGSTGTLAAWTVTHAGTTSVADELVYGAVGWRGPTADTMTPAGDLNPTAKAGTTGGSATSNVTLQGTYRIVSATGTYTTNGTISTARDHAQAIATYVRDPGGPPVNDTIPSISGTAEQGMTLTSTYGTWTNATTLAIQWRRCDAAGSNCVDVPGATSPSYVAAAGDAGATLRTHVTATNGRGSTTATSAPSAVITAAPGTGGLLGGRIVFVSDRSGDEEIYVTWADGSGQTRLTTNAVEDTQPDLSSDGTKIAFQRWDGTDFEIFVMNVDGTGQTQLTTNATPDIEPRISPDGRWIAWSNNGDIYKMTPAGGSVTAVATSAAVEDSPDWSGDSTQLVYDESGVGVQRINADGTGKTLWLNGREPVWSPTGRYTATNCRITDDDFGLCHGDWAGPDDWNDEYLTDLPSAYWPAGILYASWATGDIHWAPSQQTGTGGTFVGAGVDTHPEWGGMPIVFESMRDGNREIYRMNADGTGLLRLTTNAATDSDPSLSPMGKVVFQSDRDGDNEIYSMNIDGTGVTQLTTNTLDDADPEVSPDGTRIAFVRTTTPGPYSEVWKMQLNGASPTQVTNRNASSMIVANPAWSPLGDEIMYYDNYFFNDFITIVKADGSSERTYGTATFADWSPDGSRIVYASGSGGLWTAPSTSLVGPVQITTNGTQPVWTYGGIAFVSNRDGNNEIYRMQPDGTLQTRITNSATADEGPDWR